MKRAPGIAALAIALGAACSPSATEGPALSVDGEIVTVAEIDAVAAFYLEWMPNLGEDTARSVALEKGLLPRAWARKQFPKGVEEARRRSKIAEQMLRDRKSFDEVMSMLSETPRMKVPRPVSRSEIDPLLGVAVFGKPGGSVTAPVETTYGVVLARIDLPLDSGNPQMERVVLSVVDLLYDPSLADSEYRRLKSREDLERAKYVELRPGAFRWLPPWIRARLPFSSESPR